MFARVTGPRIVAGMLVVAGSLFPAEPAEDLVEKVENAVYAAIDRAGSAEIEARRRDYEGQLPDDPRVQALARALLEQARGNAGAARAALVRGLRSGGGQDAGDVEQVRLTASLLARLLDLGPGREGRRLLADAPTPLIELAHAALLAGDGRCAEAMAVVERVHRDVPALVEPALLAARALSRCGKDVEALAWLEAAVDDPAASRARARLALALGELLFAAGDDTAALRWCTAAERAVSPVAPYRHRARACAAAARAALGMLPGGRAGYADARRAVLRDAGVPSDGRERGGLAAAWILSSSVDPGRVRDALDLLDEFSVLPLSRRARTVRSLIRARAEARLERIDEAASVLGSFRVDRRNDPELAALLAIVRAEIAVRRNQPAEARALLDDGIALARSAGDHSVLAEALLAAAPLDRELSGPADAVERVLEAAEAWPAIRRESASPFFDPALVHRALDAALDVSGLDDASTGAEAGAAMLLARRLLRRAAGLEPMDPDEAPGIDDVRRALASRDATLVVFGIGMRRAFAWLADSSGVRAVTLPRGDALFEKLSPFLIDDQRGFSGPSSWGAQVISGLVGIPGGEQTLLVLPDGFLVGLPWALLGQSGTSAVTAGTWHSPAAVPGLDALVRAPVVLAADAQARGVALATEETTIVSETATRRWWERLLGERLEARRIATATMDRGTVLSSLRRPATLWTIRLPLLIAGRAGDAFALARRPRERRLGPVPTLDLGSMLSEATRPTVVILAPDDGWAGAEPGSVARAAGDAVSAGVDAAVVVLARRPAVVDGLVERIERRLGAGDTVREAIDEALGALPDDGYPFVSVVGEPETRVRAAGPPRWRVWGPAAAGLLIILIAILRALWPRRDPFDVEPPEE